jgi:hypothetical protein
LERLLIELESEEESTARKKKCSQVPSSDRKLLLASEEAEVNFNFRFKLKDEGI